MPDTTFHAVRDEKVTEQLPPTGGYGSMTKEMAHSQETIIPIPLK